MPKSLELGESKFSRYSYKTNAWEFPPYKSLALPFLPIYYKKAGLVIDGQFHEPNSQTVSRTVDIKDTIPKSELNFNYSHKS
jgi:hypothetical protein